MRIMLSSCKTVKTAQSPQLYFFNINALHSTRQTGSRAHKQTMCRLTVTGVPARVPTRAAGDGAGGGGVAGGGATETAV